MPKDEAMLNSEKLKSYYLFEGIGQSVSQLLIYFGIRKYCYKNSVVIWKCFELIWKLVWAHFYKSRIARPLSPIQYNWEKQSGSYFY